MPQPGWADTFKLRRNRMIASPRFQRAILRLPLLRGFAQKRAARLFETINGYVQSQAVLAAVELGLFEMLLDCPADVAEIAARGDLPDEAADRLMKALAASGFVERLGDGRWALGEQGAAFVATPGLAAMVLHHRAFYADLADPVALLRRGGGGGALAAFWNYDARRPADAQAWSALMAATQPMVAEQIIGAHDFGRHRHLLDIGGGTGRFAEAVARAVPGLHLSLFDLPPVADAAAARLAEAGLAGRIAIHRGSFLDDPLPAGADIITLVRVLHDHDDSAALALLRSIAAALPPGGTLLIAEPMAGEKGFESMGDGYFGFYLFAMGSGRPRTSKEIAAMLKSAGFQRVRRVATPMPLTVSMLVARR